jgi:hypothetical protein
MKQSDVFQVMAWVDSSLEMLRAYEGRLNGNEIRIRSLLTVIRGELARDLTTEVESEESAPSISEL